LKSGVFVQGDVQQLKQQENKKLPTLNKQTRRAGRDCGLKHPNRRVESLKENSKLKKRRERKG